MKSLAIEPWGNYALALGASVECLGVKPWTRTATTPEILRLGAEAAPEFSCLSFKASTGHFIKAAQEGVEYGVMVNSRGTCRLRYYRDLQQKILRDHGMDLYIFSLGYDGLKPPLIRFFNPSFLSFLKASARARLKVLTVDELEETAWRVRAREKSRGDTTKILNDCLKDLDSARTLGQIRWVKRHIANRFAAVKTDPEREPLKVGLVGEASVLRDRYLNHNIEEILGGLGVEVRNFFLLGPEMRRIFHIDLFSEHSRRSLRKTAEPYLNTAVGGHARESVAYTIRCADQGYDGVIHVAPSACMPEVSVRSVLRRISREKDIPVLETSFDEHSSHLGVVTRLEAFVDVLRERKAREGR
ncbi:MAG: hypothetical protein ACOCR1_05075 [Planctomycetota bacterium]